MYKPFTNYFDQTQYNQTVTNQPNRSKDQTYILNTKTATVANSSRRPLAPLKTADTYSLNSTNSNPFQTNTNLNATASPRQTIY